jgi:hypothetical protein
MRRIFMIFVVLLLLGCQKPVQKMPEQPIVQPQQPNNPLPPEQEQPDVPTPDMGVENISDIESIQPVDVDVGTIEEW